MSDLKDRAFDLAVKRHGFQVNDGNREAVYGIVDLIEKKHTTLERDYEVMYKLQQAGESDIKELAEALNEATNKAESLTGYWTHADKYKALASKHLEGK